MARATHHVQATYQMPFLAHAAMEPGNCTVHVRPDACEVWCGTQVPATAKMAAAQVAGLSPDKVVVHNCLLGGGFGRRLEADTIERAVLIAKSVSSPVKVLWSREEDTQHDHYRPYYYDSMAAGLDATGVPIAWTHRVTGSSIMARLYPDDYKGVDVDAVEGAVTTPYRLANTRVEFNRQESPVVTSWWRGVGPLHNVFVVESFIDELAWAVKQDPIAYRLASVREPRARAVLELAARKSGWGNPMSKGWGRGVSLLTSWDTYQAQVAEVEIDAQGEPRVRRVVVAIDCGQPINPDGIEAQVEGGVIFGLTAALYGQITFGNGKVEQSNFHDYRVLRMNEVPVIETHIVANHEKPGGVGEPPTAGIAPAVTNAIFAASGRRIRVLPIASTMRKRG
jgi:isoquinoline 1-oxidoreductase beta subunit